MTQIIKDLNTEVARTEELAKEEKMKDAKKIKVNKLDIKVEKDARLTFRAKLDISFKYKK